MLFRVPLSVPLCGFSGLQCPPSFIDIYFAYLVCGIVIITTSALALVVFSIYKPIEGTKSLEIGMGNSFFLLEQNRSTRSRPSFCSTFSSSDPMVLLGDRFEVRAYYSDNVLITKHKQVELKPAEYDSCVKMLKMDHENINKFIGLSLDGPDIIKVWKFCERGTLQVSVKL
ncbi:hypothetical protein ANCCEY_06524 [Ancylostoma ceylanicum]|uniref:Serine-threonine/tyrosine-protein kinase catalytic domain-containing protein n=1 Tax=Ancylostoma ceylanicum TaxID=53326 RepID=A0A0D6LT90_9BILA|nr:hypothetical protein ANCCEY_06524 [Ancylostoma ceylanicum]